MIAVDLTAAAVLREVPDPARGASDERRHQRVRIAVLGRYMLADRREYPCRTVDMSPGGVRLACAVGGARSANGSCSTWNISAGSRA